MNRKKDTWSIQTAVIKSKSKINFNPAYQREYEAKDVFNDPEIQTPEDIVKAQVNSAKKHITQDMRWVVVAHTFVGSSAKETEGERPISFVGGVENVSHEVFVGADYVALGHIHKPQKIKRDTIRYAGAPLAFGFDEQEEKYGLVFNFRNSEGVIKKAVENDKLEVWGDGSPIRDLIYSEDVARGMLHMVKNKVTEPVNLGSGTGVTIKELLETRAPQDVVPF